MTAPLLSLSRTGYAKQAALWNALVDTGRRIGRVSCAARGPDHKTRVAIGTDTLTHWDAGDKVDIGVPHGRRKATLHETVWA
jgi:dimethylsulfoniopropionate demethylase